MKSAIRLLSCVVLFILVNLLFKSSSSAKSLPEIRKGKAISSQPSAPDMGTITRVTIASDGSQSNNNSDHPAISADGRFIVFASFASNLVSDDTNGQKDIFLLDLQNGSFDLISKNIEGELGNGLSDYPAISGDGRFVAFYSRATNLTPNDTNNAGDIFVRDRLTGNFEIISVSTGNVQGNGESGDPSISSDGRYIAFDSSANNLVNYDTNGKTDVFLRDRLSGTTRMISTSSQRTSRSPSISSNGRYLAYESGVTSGLAAMFDIYIKDLQSGYQEIIPYPRTWCLPTPCYNMMDPQISGDGRYVTYFIDSGGFPFYPYIYIYDRQMHVNELISKEINGADGLGLGLEPSPVSSDGRYVLYTSHDPNLVVGDTNGKVDVFYYDRQVGLTRRISVANSGIQGNDNSDIFATSISADGRYSVFYSKASNLVSGDTNNYSDIFLFDREGVPPFWGQIVPVWPNLNNISSVVMQGGQAHRYLRIIDDATNPIAGAQVDFEFGETTESDPSGVITYTIQADSLLGIGNYWDHIKQITYNGISYPTGDQPSFPIQVIERHYENKWEYGAVRKASAGVSSGLVAYLSGNTNGGLSLSLNESDPNSTNDDQVTIDEAYTGEIGAGFGADFHPSITGTITKINGPGAHMIGELLIRNKAQVEKTFPSPYEKSSREAQGLMMLAGIADTINGYPSQPRLANILARSNLVIPYDQVTASMGVHEKADLGIDGLEIGLLLGKIDSEMNLIDLDLLSATGDMTVMGGRRYYPNLVSSFISLDLNWNTANLTTVPGPIQNQLGNYVGDFVWGVLEEVYYDKSTGNIDHIELTISSNGNDLTFTDIDQGRVEVKYIIPGDQVTPQMLQTAQNLQGLIRSLASQDHPKVMAGDDPILAEIEGILKNVGFAEYQIITEDGIKLNLVPEIDWNIGPKLDFGAGLEVKKSRQLLYQEGVLLNGMIYPTTDYRADPLVSRPGKDWIDLAMNAIGGLFDVIKDGFSWIIQQVTSGVSWVISVVAKTTDGIIRGGAMIQAPNGSQLYRKELKHIDVSLEPSETITVTATSWLPVNANNLSNLPKNPNMAVASGDNFVIGGIYEFQPYTLTIMPEATLTISYTQAALGSLDEHNLGLFRWNPDQSNWQFLPATADYEQNLFMVQIDRLGTFALGYDSIPPQIDIVSPANGSKIQNGFPLISGLISDSGVGVDSTSVEMRVDNELVSSNYISGTGQLAYLPLSPLAKGSHIVTITAADAVGNSSTTTSTFIVDGNYKLFLPTVIR